MRATPFSLQNKIYRVLWKAVWLFLFRPTPRSFHAWRCLLLRAFGARLGEAVHPYPSARIWAPWNLEMGDHSCLSEDVDCYCVDKIRIGPHATVSQYSFLCTVSHDYKDPAIPLVTARSTVFSDIASWTVAAGNPAKSVKNREFLFRETEPVV